MDNLRKILKEQFNVSPNGLDTNKRLFSKIPDKVSNLGCLEFKYHCEHEDIDGKVEEMKPFFNDLGVKYFSIIKMSNMLVITVNSTNVEEVKKICQKFGLLLVKETMSDAPKPYNAMTDNNAPENELSTDYGRGNSDGRSTFASGSMMTGFPVDRLAGE